MSAVARRCEDATYSWKLSNDRHSMCQLSFAASCLIINECCCTKAAELTELAIDLTDAHGLEATITS